MCLNKIESNKRQMLKLLMLLMLLAKRCKIITNTSTHKHLFPCVYIFSQEKKCVFFFSFSRDACACARWKSMQFIASIISIVKFVSDLIAFRIERRSRRAPAHLIMSLFDRFFLVVPETILILFYFCSFQYWMLDIHLLFHSFWRPYHVDRRQEKIIRQQKKK